MRALTVCQPWAWAIFHAGKNIKNRTWTNRHVTGTIAIHAGCKVDCVDDLPRGVKRPGTGELVRGAIIGVIDVAAVVRRSRSKWFNGPLGWFSGTRVRWGGRSTAKAASVCGVFLEGLWSKSSSNSAQITWPGIVGEGQCPSPEPSARAGNQQGARLPDPERKDEAGQAQREDDPVSQREQQDRRHFTAAAEGHSPPGGPRPPFHKPPGPVF